MRHAIFTAHRDDVKKRMPTARAAGVDLMIAQRLRVTQHTPAEIAEMIERWSQNADWADGYGARIAADVETEHSLFVVKKHAKKHLAWIECEERALAALPPEPAPLTPAPAAPAAAARAEQQEPQQARRPRAGAGRPR